MVFLLLQSHFTFCQRSDLSFENEALEKVIKNLEQRTDYIFNYDPELLKGYTYTGEVDPEKINETLDALFLRSPYTFEVVDKTILIFQGEPREYRICGHIRDAVTLEPLISASVSAIGTNIGSQSDLNGFFDFDLTAEKDQTIEIRYIGYKTKIFYVVDLKKNECPNFNLELDEDLLGKEIIITDYILDGISQGDAYSSFNIDYERLSQNHSEVEHDILKTAQLLPGINSIDDSAINLQIRGSNTGQNLILWEGVPLYNAGHIFGMISAINPFSVDKINIYKGAHDPRYDNRVGGILDISLSDDLADGFHGSVGTTLTELHSNLSIPVVKEQLTIELAGRKSFSDIYNSPTLKAYTDKVFQFSIIDDRANLLSPEELDTEQTLDYHDWNAKLLYKPSDRLKIDLGLYSNTQDFNYSFRIEEEALLAEDIIKLNTNIINTKVELDLTKNWASRILVYNSSYDNNYEKSETENGIINRSNNQLNRLQEKSFTFSNDLQLGSKVGLNLGYEYNIKDVTLDLGDEINFDFEFVPIKNEQAHFHNLFHSIRLNTGKLQIDAGNRTSYYQELSKWFHSPRINLQYSLSSNFKLKADAGTYHQFISQLTNVGADQIKVDNPLWILNDSNTSLSQTANKIGGGFIFQKDDWLIDLDAYYNHTNNISTIAPQLGVFTADAGFSKGSSRVIGLDLLIKKRWYGINTWLNYSLGSAEYDFEDLSEKPFTAPNDIRHNLSLVTSYKYRNLLMSLTANYHSGLPYSLPALVPNTEDPDAEDPFLFFLEYDNYNSYRLNPYVRFDLNLAYRFNFKLLAESKMEISCSLVNLFNRTNYVTREYYVDYNAMTREYRSSPTDKSLLGRTALLLLRIYW